jgi:site-specific recombinase XerD
MSSITRERAKGPSLRPVDFYGAFLDHVERERSAATRESYGRILGQLQAAHPQPDKLTPEQVRDWLNRPVGDRFHAHGPRAVSTKRTEIGCLKACWRFLADSYGLTNIMAEVAMPPKPKRLRPKSVTRAQVNELLSTLPTESQRALVLLMADAGLRVSEACAITPDRIVLDGKRRHLRVLGKGNVERLVPIGGRLAGALAAQLEEHADKERTDDHHPRNLLHLEPLAQQLQRSTLLRGQSHVHSNPSRRPFLRILRLIATPRQFPGADGRGAAATSKERKPPTKRAPSRQREARW